MACCPPDTLNRCRDLVKGCVHWSVRPDPKIPGIYVIKHNGEVIYVGHSGDIRTRLNQHFSNSGTQAIDKYLQRVDKNLVITVNWISDPDHQNTENCYVQGVADVQRKWPMYNMNKGNACPKVNRQ